MMKWILYAVILPLLIFSLGACDKKEPKLVNTLSEAKLTNKEKEILSTTTNQSYVFDFHTDGSYKKLAVWIEKYEFGKLANSFGGSINSKIKDKGSIIFATLKTSDDQDQIRFNISINNDDGTSVISTMDKISQRLNASTSSSNGAKNTPIVGEMILASICYSVAENGMSSLSTDFYQDMDKHIDEIKNYGVVYLIKCEFK